MAETSQHQWQQETRDWIARLKDWIIDRVRTEIEFRAQIDALTAQTAAARTYAKTTSPHYTRSVLYTRRGGRHKGRVWDLPSGGGRQGWPRAAGGRPGEQDDFSVDEVLKKIQRI